MTLQMGIYNHATGENIVRNMTEEEILQWEAGKAAAEVKAQAEAEAAAAKAALLAKLGITEEEARLLLGGN